MSELQIKKGKLLKNDRIEVEYEKTEADSSPAHCKEEHTSPPHADLKKAFQALVIHAAIIGEFVSASIITDIRKHDPEIIENFNVTGFTVAGANDDEGVILSARKTLKSGKTMGFNTPKILLNTESETAYEFAEDLGLCVADCKDQLIEYLQGKIAPDPQGVLFLDEESDVVHGEKKKVRGRKKKEKEELV